MDKNIPIVVVGNETGVPLLIVKQLDEIISDSLVFQGLVDGTEYGSGEINAISIPSFGVKSLPNTEKLYLYVFRTDSLNSLRKHNEVTGIIRKCQIGKYSIQLNKVTDKVDTIHIR